MSADAPQVPGAPLPAAYPQAGDYAQTQYAPPLPPQHMPYAQPRPAAAAAAAAPAAKPAAAAAAAGASSAAAGAAAAAAAAARDQDRLLPIANIARIMKRAIPANGKLSKEAKSCVQECVSEFIGFITSEASERLGEDKRKTITGDDIIESMRALGFDAYIGFLQTYLVRYRESTKGGRATPVKRGRKKGGEDGGDDDDDDGDDEPAAAAAAGPKKKKAKGAAAGAPGGADGAPAAGAAGAALDPAGAAAAAAAAAVVAAQQQGAAAYGAMPQYAPPPPQR